MISGQRLESNVEGNCDDLI